MQYQRLFNLLLPNNHLWVVLFISDCSCFMYVFFGNVVFKSYINDMDDIMLEWHDYVVEMREKDLQLIIEQENLKPDETRKFIENAFRDGEIKTTSTDIDKIMPPVSRFGGGRTAKKQNVIARLLTYFDKFYGIGI